MICAPKQHNGRHSCWFGAFCFLGLAIVIYIYLYLTQQGEDSAVRTHTLVRTSKGLLPREQFVEDNAERIDVRGGGVGLVADDFRRHVAIRARLPCLCMYICLEGGLVSVIVYYVWVVLVFWWLVGGGLWCYDGLWCNDSPVVVCGLVGGGLMCVIVYYMWVGLVL